MKYKMMKISKKRKNLLYFFVAALILTSLALIFILPSLGSPGHLELYDAKDEHDVIFYKICYLRWHGKETELKIEYMWNGVKCSQTVNDGDTFVLKIPRYLRQCGWVEIRYDHRLIIVHGVGKLREVPWYK